MWISLSIVLIILFLASLIVIGFLILFIKSNINNLSKTKKESSDDEKPLPEKEKTSKSKKNNAEARKDIIKNYSPEELLFILESQGGMDDL